MKALCRISVLTGFALTGGSLMADGFNNSQFSPVMVSPAQTWQYKDNRVEGQFSQGTSDTTVDSADSKVETSVSDMTFQAAGTYRIPNLPVTTSLELTNQSAEADFKGVDFGAEWDILLIRPGVSLDINKNIAVGLSVGFAQSDFDYSGPFSPEDDDDSWTESKLGVVWHNDRAEAGLAYEPKIGERDDQDGYSAGSRTTVHGRYAIHPIVAVGGSLTRAAYSEESELRKDVNETSLTVEVSPLPEWSIEGAWGYQPASYDDKKDIDESNLERQMVSLSTDYAMTKALSVGGLAGFEKAEGSDDQDDIGNDKLRLGLRGAWTF